VIEATLKETGKKYAIKQLNKAHIVKEKKQRYVKTERDILVMCQHPNVVSLFSTFSDPENLYYVLELCPGGELFSRLREHGSLDLECTRFYMAELVSAMQYLHDRHVIHRDLKPENILLSETLHLKLTDFGTTKRLEPTETMARSNSFVGTPAYACPELLDKKETSMASDLWALGVILYQCLTGRLPFRAATAYLIFQAVLSCKVEWPTNLEDFPMSAKDLIEKLLTREPEDRIGAGPQGYAELKEHPFFHGIEWDTLNEQTPPEFRPYPVPLVFASDEARKKEAEEQEKKESTATAACAAPPAAAVASVDEFAVTEYNQEATAKWSKHLNKNEKVLFCGQVLKTKGLSTKKRMLLLTDDPRLIYVDQKKDETKGQIPWHPDLTPTIKASNKAFEIVTPSRKWHLQCCSKNASAWVDAINEEKKRQKSMKAAGAAST